MYQVPSISKQQSGRKPDDDIKPRLMVHKKYFQESKHGGGAQLNLRGLKLDDYEFKVRLSYTSFCLNK